MIRSFCALVLLFSCSVVHAGLAVTPTSSPIVAGTTVLFDLAIVNPTTTSPTVPSINIIGPNILFTVGATTGTGTSPAFVASGVPALVGDWAVSIIDPTFISTNLNPAATMPATFGQLSVDIPADFEGGFEIVLANSIDVFNAGPIVDQIAGGTQFAFSAVPEPSSYLLLGLVGSGCAGLQYVRRRKKANAA